MVQGSTMAATGGPPRSSSLRAPGTEPTQHAVEIKVLRLSRPALVQSDSVPGPVFPTPVLTLPKSLGSVYVGEMFSCVLSVSNTSEEIVHAQLHVEVITPSRQRFSLADDSSESMVELEHKQSFTRAVRFETKELGPHSLSVSVIYDTETEKFNLKKGFRFDTAAAIQVRTKAVLGLDSTVVVEAQIENMSETPMTIETCSLVPVSGWSPEPIAKETPLLRPRDVYQFCFIASGGQGRDIGQVSIGWRREPLGVKGWLSSGSVRL